MPIFLLLTAVLMLLARLRASSGRVSRRLVQISLALPPLGLIVAGLLSWSIDRTRINVQFVGYRIPESQLRPCGRPADPADRRGEGVWIGGGVRWPNDPAVDRISLPGWRSHLVELCADQTGKSIGMRVAAPGSQFNGNQLARTNDIDTQLVAIDARGDAPSRECLRVGGRIVPLAPLIDFAHTKHEEQLDATAATQALRTRVLGALRPFGSGNEVYCIDIAAGAPRPCGADLTSTAAPLFLWKEQRGWSSSWRALPPQGAEWCACDGSEVRTITQDVTLPYAELPTRSSWQEWRQSAPRVHLRMLTRRSVGGVVDQSVPLPLDRFDTAPLRLGKDYDFRIGRLAGNSLVVIAEEPSVQLRLGDLYGPVAAPVEDGVFDLFFGAPTGEELLSIDLSSRADHLRPKPIFENIRARVSVPSEGDLYTITVADRRPEKRPFGEVFALDAVRTRGASPLLVIQRVKPPLATFLLPLVASLLLIVAVGFERRGDPTVAIAWVIVPIVTAFLALRFALSTRLLLDDYAAPEALHVWIENGAWFFLAPMLVIAAPVILSRGGKAARVTRTSALYEHYDVAARPSRIANFRTAAVGWWRNLLTRDNVPLTEWVIVGVFCTVTWIAVAASDWRFGFDVGVKVFATVALAMIAALLARLVEGWLGAHTTTADAAATSSIFMTAPPARWRRFVPNSVVFRALVVGVVYLVLRALLTLPLGSQEQTFGSVRVDVLSLPVAAALLAAFTRPNESNRAQRRRFAAIVVLFVVCFCGVGVLFNDFGLVWIGGMALVLALPAACGDHLYAYGLAAALFAALFVSPIFAPKPFLEVLRLIAGRTQTVDSGGAAVEFADELQVARSRDYYRLLDGNRPEDVESIPSQLAREVVIERERVRYQSLDGAWREAFRMPSDAHSHWLGAGFLRGRPIVGDPTFRQAAQSDYVYPAYLRAEFGTLGMLAALLLYVALFVVGAFPAVDRGRAPLALWSASIGVGTALFMLGGTARLFPFSGKWPLLLSFGSDSDAALSFALLMLMVVERD